MNLATIEHIFKIISLATVPWRNQYTYRWGVSGQMEQRNLVCLGTRYVLILAMRIKKLNGGRQGNGGSGLLL
jgi:hypothetical protein